MGVLSALGQFNENVEDATDAVVDNEAFSIQDTVRGVDMALRGYEDEEAYARDVSQDYEDATDAVTDRAGELTDNEVIGGAGAGADAVFDMFVGTPVKAAYGTLTGVNTMTDNPNQAGTEYSPDALDTLDVALTATGGGKAAAAGVKGASRAARATRAADSTMLGGLARVGRRLQSAVTGGAARTVDDAATSARTTYRRTGSRQWESLKTPDELLGTNAATSAADSAADAGGLLGSNKLLAGIGAGGIGLGAAGVIGGPTTYPDGYAVDKTYPGNPPADRVKQTDGEGNTRGYWVVVDSNGEQVTYLSSSGTSTTTFPANTPPPFNSAGQANSAYERWRSEARNSAQDPGAYEDRPDATKSAWGNAASVKSLGSGWHLFRQDHRTEDKTRYLVAGRNANGRLIYLTAGGGVTTSPAPLPSASAANDAFNGWREDARNGNVRGPDPGADRPREDEVEKDAPDGPGSNSNGGGGMLSLLLVGGGAAVLIALVAGVIL